MPSAFNALPDDDKFEMMAFVRWQDDSAAQFQSNLADRKLLEPAAAAVLVTHNL